MNTRGFEAFIIAATALIIIVVVFVTLLSFLGISFQDYVTGSMEAGEDFFDAVETTNN